MEVGEAGLHTQRDGGRALTGIGRRVVFVAMDLCILVTVAYGHSSPRATDFSWTGLPEGLRQRVILNASEVPPFPKDPESLRGVRHWPKTRLFDGKTYRISYSHWESDVFWSVDDVQKIPTGHSYSASYTRDHDGKRSWRGPYYSWTPDHRVTQRSWSTENAREIWGYGPDGRLMQYSRSSSRGNRPWFSCSRPQLVPHFECFDSAGHLIGFGTAEPYTYYWAGYQRTSEEFERLRRAWDPWYAIRDSVWRARATINAPGTSSSPAPAPPPRSRRGT